MSSVGVKYEDDVRRLSYSIRIKLELLRGRSDEVDGGHKNEDGNIYIINSYHIISKDHLTVLMYILSHSQSVSANVQDDG